MKLLLTKGSTTWDVTKLLTTTTWSGDKSTACRQLSTSLLCVEGSSLPVAEIGDRLTLEEGDPLFDGMVLRRNLTSEVSTMTVLAFDDGYRLQRNDGTYKFTGAAPEIITRQVCSDLGLKVAALPETGLKLARKFSAVACNQIVSTVWSLASEKSGSEYALRYTPAGLLVKVRSVSTDSLVLATGSNLMDASTIEDATKVVNSVAIFNSDGELLRRMGDQASQQLLGIMEGHLVQGEDDAAAADDAAAKALQEGQQKRTVTVNVLGDTRLLTGETVVAQEESTGLTGVFWIDADIHTWKNNTHYTRLDLNCRNVMQKQSAGSEIK